MKKIKHVRWSSMQFLFFIPDNINMEGGDIIIMTL